MLGLSSFQKLVDQVIERNPLQKKALQEHLAIQDQEFWKRAERVFSGLEEGLGEDCTTLVQGYLRLCREMLAEQVRFKKTGCYSATSASAVNSALYSTDREMTERTCALGVSQFLWPNHYKLFDFFLAQLAELRQVSKYLEVGPGHGIHLVFALDFLSEADVHVIDISEASLRLARGMVQRFHPGKIVQFHHGDVMEMDVSGRTHHFDFIVVNEVLEHLDDPAALLTGIRPKLSDRGHLFITTCANAPTMDHVYLYRSVEEIQDQIVACGFEIVREIAVPVGDIPREQWTTAKTEINYGALLRSVEGKR